MLLLPLSPLALSTTTGGLPELPTGQRLQLATQPFNKAGVGGRVWASAPVLCDWLRGQLEPGDSVLELGSGTGAVGLYAAGLGASRVVLTDGGPPALLELLAANVDANRPLLPADSGLRLEVETLRWGGDAADLPDGPFSWVLASDVTYDDELHAPLCDSLAALLRRAGELDAAPRVVLAMEHLDPVEAAAGRFGDRGLEDFRAAAAACGLGLCRPGPPRWLSTRLKPPAAAGAAQPGEEACGSNDEFSEVRAATPFGPCTRPSRCTPHPIPHARYHWPRDTYSRRSPRRLQPPLAAPLHALIVARPPAASDALVLLAPQEFSWPIEAFAEALPFVVEVFAKD